MNPVRVQSRLDDPERAAVRALARAAEDVDGVAPLGEHTLIGLERSGRTHLIAGDLDGYAQRDGDGAELVVHPDRRRRGVGTALLDALRADREVQVWAHGTVPGAVALAERVGATPTRRLLLMGTTLPDELAQPALPAGLSLRAFLPGLDDEEWLTVNARAFVALPDQGGWTRADLADRMAQGWFDPDGFLLAVDEAGRIRGFHWTKATQEPRPGGGHEHVGEVYVVGVDPGARGGGLGRALTVAGLHHLAASGIRRVTLFVDAANAAALPMYASLGFAVERTDTLYHVPGKKSSAS